MVFYKSCMSVLNVIMDVIKSIISICYEFLWGDLVTIPLPGGGSLGLSLLVIILIPSGVYFTIKTKAVLFRFFPEMIRITMEKKNEETKESKENENGKPVNVRYLRREFAYSRFQQTLILPEDVDKKKIGAKVENGVLTISLPKIVIKEEPKVAQNIEIL